MAKQRPFTSQEERLQRLIRNAELKIVALKDMIDTAERVVAAETVELGNPASPLILSASEGGTLETGEDSPMRVIGTITDEASHTGDTNETELGKITVPGNSMGAHGFIRLYVSFRALRTGGGTGNHTFKAYFGGSLLASYTGNFANLMLDMTPRFVWNQGATNVQSSGFRLCERHIRTAEAPFAATKDTTADVDITFTVQNAVAAHTAYLRAVFVEAFFSN